MRDYLKNTDLERLKNGLTVITCYVPSEVVAIQMWVKTGSRNEKDSEAGLSHVCEHLLFKGRVEQRVFNFAEFIENKGGEVNAWTSHDDTVYHFTIPKGDFESGLFALTNLLRIEGWSEEDLKNELNVIKEEIVRDMESPFSYLTQLHYHTAYEVHPYRRPILGYVKTIDRFTEELILEYYRRWYVPSNIVLVIAGGVKNDEAIKLVEKFFGDIEDRKVGGLERVEEPLQKRMKIKGDHFVTTLPLVELSFKGTCFRDEATPILDLATYILGGSKNSRLIENLVEKKRLLSAYAYNYTPIDRGLIHIGATLKMEEFFSSIELLLDEVFNFAVNGIDYYELEQAIKNYRITRIYGLETVSSIAKRLAVDYIYGGSIEFEKIYKERIEESTLEEFNLTIKEYITPETLTITYLLPENRDFKEVDDRIFRIVKDSWRKVNKAHNLYLRRVDKLSPEYKRYDIGENGVLLIRRDRRLPLLSLVIGTYGGLRAESPEKNGISYLCSVLCTKGTKHYTRRKLTRIIEEYGIYINGFSGRNLIGLTLNSTDYYFVEARKLLRDILLYPNFSKKEFLKERDKLIEHHKLNETRPSIVAWLRFFKELFGEHPYSRPIKGMKETLLNINCEDVKEFYSDVLSNNRIVFSASGQFNEESLIEILEELLSYYNNKERRREKRYKVEPILRKRVIVERVPKKMSYIIYGFQGTSFQSHDRYGLEIVSEYLGRQSGRLFYKLREERGLVYSLGCRNIEGIEKGYFAIYTATSPENIEEVLKIIEEELEKITERKIDIKELEGLKQYLYGSNLISLQTNKSHATQMLYGELYGYGYTEYLNYRDRIEEWDPEKLFELCNRYLKSQAPVIVIATDREEINL